MHTPILHYRMIAILEAIVAKEPLDAPFLLSFQAFHR